MVRVIGTNPRSLKKRPKDLKKDWNNPNLIIVEIGWNTEKSPSELKKLIVTQIDSATY